ncbi:hypothetical protein ID866_8846 [Astraeus odoratus]|nr:hypothetical protein ID866_8846 [Astraeus odoratus]
MQAKVEHKEPKLSFADAPKPSEQERTAAAKSMAGFVKAFAWPVHRWPADRRICEDGTKIHLPRTYLATGGVDVRHVRRGADINQLVHRHYTESVGDEEGHAWTNFVHSDEVIMRRHEYLGPDPRVAGYFFDANGEIHVRWWDAFLKEQWMDDEKWTLNVSMDASGRWVVKED